MDTFSGVALCQRFRSLVDTKTTAISVSHFLLPVNRLEVTEISWTLAAVIFIVWTKPISCNPDWCGPYSRLFRRMSLQSLLLLLVLGGKNNSINDESTMVPFFRIKSHCSDSSTTCTNSYSYKLFRISRVQNRPSVSPPAPDCWIGPHKNLKTHDCQSSLLLCPCPTDWKILHQVNSQHSFQIMELIAAFSFVIAWLNKGNPLFLENDTVYLCQKSFLLCFARTVASSSLRLTDSFVCSRLNYTTFSNVGFCAVLP